MFAFLMKNMLFYRFFTTMSWLEQTKIKAGVDQLLDWYEFTGSACVAGFLCHAAK